MTALRLERKIHEEIVIGKNDIIIKIMKILKHKVELLIIADKSIPIHRREVFEKIEQKKLRGEE